MHRIRLRRPWTKTQGDQIALKSDVPDVGKNEDADEINYLRSFNSPTGLSDQCKVFLAISGWRGTIKAALLNETMLPTDQPPLRIEITATLKPSNQIQIQIIRNSKEAPSLSGEVQLEIEEPSLMRDHFTG